MIANVQHEARDAEIRLRSALSTRFPNSYAGNIAWDVLLQLDAAERNNVSISAIELCHTLSVSNIELLRCVAVLSADGYVAHQMDPHHPEQKFIELTDEGRSQISAIFADALNKSVPEQIFKAAKD